MLTRALFTGLGPAQLVIIMLVSLILIFSMKAGKSLLSTPVTINLDKHEVMKTFSEQMMRDVMNLGATDIVHGQNTYFLHIYLEVNFVASWYKYVKNNMNNLLKNIFFSGHLGKW